MNKYFHTIHRLGEHAMSIAPDISPKKTVPTPTPPEVPPRRREREAETDIAQGAAAAAVAGGGDFEDEWTCANCTLINTLPCTVCAVCFKTKDYKNPGSLIQCPQCTYLNPRHQRNCEMCESPLTEPHGGGDKESSDNEGDDLEWGGIFE